MSDEAYVTLEEASAYGNKRLKELNMSDKQIKLNYDKILNDTEGKLAILFEMCDLRTWIPRSVISEMNDKTITVPLWYAEKEELEEYIA